MYHWSNDDDNLYRSFLPPKNQLNILKFILKCLLTYWNVIRTAQMIKLKSLVLFGGDYIYGNEKCQQPAKYKAMSERCAI